MNQYILRDDEAEVEYITTSKDNLVEFLEQNLDENDVKLAQLFWRQGNEYSEIYELLLETDSGLNYTLSIFAENSEGDTTYVRSGR